MAGRLVSSALVREDLKDPTVQAVLAQMSDGACAADPASQFAFACTHSLVVRLLALVSIKDSVREDGAAPIRLLAQGLKQRLQQHLITFWVDVSKVDRYIKSMVSFSKDNKGGVFFVDSLHVLLGTRVPVLSSGMDKDGLFALGNGGRGAGALMPRCEGGRDACQTADMSSGSSAKDR